MKNKLSPMMTHYLSLKEKNPDCLILYRLGDFYEMFFDDAKEASKILDLTLTGRDCGLEERAAMCGVPHFAVEGYLSKLVKAGKKVAICEQLSSPKDQVGMVKRDIIRILTPGTYVSDDKQNSKENVYLASISCIDAMFGVAWIDVSTGEFNVISVKKDGLLDLLNSLSLSEIISSKAALPLLQTPEFTSSIPKAQAYYDYAYDFDNASAEILKFYNILSYESFGLQNLHFTIPAVGSLLNYIKETQKQSLSNISYPKYLDSSQNMILDYSTIKNLELLNSLDERAKGNSLSWVIDKTMTNMGSRLLKKIIKQPYICKEKINERLDCVSELIEKIGLRTTLNKLLNEIRDIERLTAKISSNTINPKECVDLNKSIMQSMPIVSALVESKLSSNLLKNIVSDMVDLSDICELLTLALNDNPPITLKDGGIFKLGYDSTLDKLRQAMSEGDVWMRAYEAAERERVGIKNLKVDYNRVFGYYIEISKQSAANAPVSYQRKQTLANCERFTTPTLKEMESLILGSNEKSVELENNLYQEIKKAISLKVKDILNNSRLIADLDVLNSFANVSVENNYVRPKILNMGGTISIQNGRHPVIEKIKKQNEFVSNDTYFDKDARMAIITGPNMAGKSTYMRQIALIVIMAHLGCFVPAETAEISLVDKIFTRIGASDNLSQGQSTFMVEMIEVANILNNATDSSLLILDEVGRGTSTLDGLSIAWAITEDIALKVKAKTLFSTHYHELCGQESILKSVKNYHMLIQENNNKISFLYKLARGGTSKSFGIEVAALAGVSVNVVKRAKKIMEILAQNSVSVNLNDLITENITENAVPISQTSFFDDILSDSEKEVFSILRELNIDKCTPIEALTILNNLKNKLPSKISATKK